MSGKTLIASFVKLNSLTLLNISLINYQRVSQRQLIVHVIHRPPNTSKCKFIEELNSYMEPTALSPYENIILEDVNIHVDSPNCWAINFNSVLSDFDFIQHDSTSTHTWTYPSCTSKSFTASACHYVKDGISNHLAVFHNVLCQKFVHGKMLRSPKTWHIKINVNSYLTLYILSLSRLLTKQQVYYHTNSSYT